MTWWTGKRLAIALVGSLALNLFFAGMLVALVAVDRDRGHGRGRVFDFRAAASEVSGDSRQEIRRIWRTHREEMRPKVRAFHDARRQMRELLVTEGELDRAAIEQGMTDLRQRANEFHLSMFELMTRIAETLPPDERRRFFRKALRGGPHGRGRY